MARFMAGIGAYWAYRHIMRNERRERRALAKARPEIRQQERVTGRKDLNEMSAAEVKDWLKRHSPR